MIIVRGTGLLWDIFGERIWSNVYTTGHDFDSASL
jgi:hypothetical protein